MTAESPWAGLMRSPWEQKTPQHECSIHCVCPDHGFMHYWAQGDSHACTAFDCDYGSRVDGRRSDIVALLRFGGEKPWRS